MEILSKKTNKALAFALYLLPFMLNVALIDFIIPIKYDVVLDNLPIFGILITMAWLISTVLDFAIGGLTDRLGVKKTLMLGIGLGFIGTILFGLTSNVFVMTFAIALWGFSYVMFAIPSETYVLSSFKANDRGSSFGILNFILDIAYAVAPLMGFIIITYWGINQAIFMAAAITLFSILLLTRLRKDGKEDVIKSIEDVVNKDGIVKKEFKDILKMNIQEVSILLNMFMGGFWFMTMFIAAPLLFFHASEDLLRGALLTSAFMLPFALMELFFGRIADHARNRFWMIKIGFLVSAILLVVFFFVENFIWLLVTAFFIAFFLNMGWVGSEVHMAKYLPKGKKGEFTSIFIAGRDIGYDLAPMFYGFIAILGLKVPFLFLGIMLFAVWTFFVISHRNYKE